LSIVGIKNAGRAHRRLRVPKVGVAAAVLAVVASSVVGVAAGAATTAKGSITTSATKGAPIVIGTILDEGVAQDNNYDRVATIKAGIDAINKSGGINGHPLQLLYCNGQADLNTELACAREMVTKHVDAVLGAEVENPSVVGLLNAAKIADIDTEAISPETFTTRDSFLLSGGANYQVSGVVDEAAHAGLKRIYMVANTGSAYPSFGEAVAKKDGITWAGQSLIPTTESNYDPVAAQVANSHADAVALIMTPQQSVATADAMVAAGLHVTLLFNGDVPDPTELESITDAPNIKFLIAADTPPPSATQIPAIRKFETELAAYHKKTGTPWAVNSALRMSAVRVWVDTQIFAEIVKTLKTVNATTIRTAYLNAKTVTGLGMVPKWTPTKKGCLAGYPDVSNPYEWFLTLKNGEFVLLTKNEKAVSMNPFLCS
jgi:ABC-type branched-subunit amino acid transport system substrate-binding protein